MSEFIPEILEERIVAQDDSGAKMSWNLLTTEEGKTQWEPKAEFPDGTVQTPIWMPLPGSQYLFLECPIYEALYEGTRGPGKTLTLLMDFCKEVGKGYGKLWRGEPYAGERLANRLVGDDGIPTPRSGAQPRLGEHT